jgi:hypothetical protein
MVFEMGNETLELLYILWGDEESLGAGMMVEIGDKVFTDV